jgi:hypothetical protein
MVRWWKHSLATLLIGLAILPAMAQNPPATPGVEGGQRLSQQDSESLLKALGAVQVAQLQLQNAQLALQNAQASYQNAVLNLRPDRNWELTARDERGPDGKTTTVLYWVRPKAGK